MTRKFFINSFNNNHVVFEQVRGGCRAVSPCFYSLDQAKVALAILKAAEG